MKIFHTLLIIFLLLSFSQTYGNSEEESGCGTASGYALYTCRKAKMCKKEKFKINKPLLEREGNTYKELPEDNESLLKEGKKIYRERIGKLYSCGILSVQKNSYEKNSTLLDIATPSLKTTKKRSQKQIEQIKRKIKKLECKEYKNEEKNTLKQDMLKEATYEMCDYINYLEYLKGYYNVPSNTLREQGDISNKNTVSETDKGYTEGADEGEEDIKWGKKVFTTGYITQSLNSKILEVEAEKSQTYKVFPIAFQSFNEYDSNFAIHTRLEILKQDFIVLRRKLHAALNPINQLIYKIHNAMSK